MMHTMPERFPQTLEKTTSERLHFYEDLGINLFYKRRGEQQTLASATQFADSPAASATQQISDEDSSLPKSTRKLDLANPSAQPAPRAAAPPIAVPAAATLRPVRTPDILPVPSGPTLFEAFSKVPDDTLLKIRSDLGECTRCKLHKTRHSIVFGDGNPKAELVFVGEGPGHDEDMQGLPFVGRAGKLLTQMIEAMGLQRKDVYICNVVKCRPPENRAPEKDEVGACSPFLLRQIDSIAPKVIVCLGSTAAQTVLETNRGISQFRGQWLDFRGRKLMATYHPAYLLRNPSAKSEVWKDLQKVMAVLGLEPKKGKSADTSKPS
jgi:DNA polymerase